MGGALTTTTERSASASAAALTRSPVHPANLVIDPSWDATFVPLDPPRASYFALWDPAPQHDLGLASDRGWTHRDVTLVGPDGRPALRSAAVLTIRQAVELFARLPAGAGVTSSVRTWAAVVRAALGVIARGRVLPAVSDDGWDAWRVGPLDGDQRIHLDALADALPPIAHAAPFPGRGDPRECSLLLSPEEAVDACLDAVADRLVRSPAASALTTSPLFAQLQPTRVPQLSAWAAEIGDRHCRSSLLDILVEAPIADKTETADLDISWLTEESKAFGPDHSMSARSTWRLEFGLRSQRDPSLWVSAVSIWPNLARGVAPRGLGERADIELVTMLREAADICAELVPALDQLRPTHLELDDEAFDRFLASTDDLAGAGVEVRWSTQFGSADLDRRLVISDTSAPGGSGAQVADFASLIAVDWEFLLDGVALSPAELEVLSLSKRSIVPIRGRWVRLTPRSRRQLRLPAPDIDLGAAIRAARTGRLGLCTGRDDGGAIDGAPDTSLGDEVEVRFDGSVAAWVARIERLTVGREQEEPAGLEATLRPYQRRGLAWMADLAELGLGGCLADDMGLGKTVQVLALHSHRGRRTLVVCPTSLLANWERETKRFLPGTKVRRYHGPGRSLADLADHELVVTTYGVVRSDHEALARIGWDLMIADEAQHAKNPRSRTARALRMVPAAVRMALTGTPVENRLSELWSIMDWAVPGILGGHEEFRRTLAVPIERDDDARAAGLLTDVVRPFLLRRVKTDPEIAPDLPPKTELDVVVPLTAEQVSLYHATVSEILALVRGLDGAERHGLVLKLLTGLKQITNHPAQYLGQTGPLAGRSGKLDALDDLVDRALLADEHVLVFSQYVAMGRLLEQHLADRGIEVALLHGGLSTVSRQNLVDRFQAGEIDVLVLSLKAAGTGLNLTRATQVIHYDRWWNPAVEDQATDRAHRIGQDRTVTVHRIFTEGTVEDRVAELLTAKRRLADRVVGGGDGWIAKLGDDELEALVSLSSGDPR